MSSDLHVTVAARLHQVGQRFTPGRRALVDVLDASERPLTLPEILEHDSSVAQSSAYRNLSVLERASVVRRISTTDEWARFELAEDLTEHHHHLICGICGTVEDFTVGADLELAVDRALRRIARRRGFAPEHHRLDLIGTCSRCV
ncbi:MAG: transcriptional repressor [Acidimicrobiia bacterium]|nr:transcriptional repressor [Acidimicrobiia bacterium]